ncbi:MAG: bifunctional D-glycero-beta-D-manno-heptose-7-phosphate kinase/D-glycero-beta-D-manno-heptose 1-phosphate adenylyltransferase HldE [Fibrobacterales bacterium]
MHLDFSKTTVLIIGDIMLDRYYIGNVDRISPEAPVPVIRVTQTRTALGGAANVANNISHLGARATLIGFCGHDSDYHEVKVLSEKQDINLHITTSSNPTITKSRVIGEHQQITRLDFESSSPYSANEITQLEEAYIAALPQSDIVIISDYGKGVCTPELCQTIINQARKAGKKVIVDPKGQNWQKYQYASFITPNFKEFREHLAIDIDNADSAIEQSAPNILKRLHLENLLVTRSQKGMTLITNNDEFFHRHTEARDVFDVSGAGDTVVATLATGIASGMTSNQAISVANSAAGIVVGKMGTAPIEIRELKRKIFDPDLVESPKIVSREQLNTSLAQVKHRDKTVIFTNGCFDLVHRGHLQYLKKARNFGDILIIGLNSDQSVQKLKGPDRPINNENDRALMLASLEFVDYVTIFNEETPFELLKEIQPSILVKGGDYALEDVVGREFADEVRLVQFVDGYSTTNIIKKMEK